MTDPKGARNDLTEGTVWKKLIVFFLPIAAGTCIQQLYNAVDGLIVGRFVGTVALAAVGGSAANILNVLIGFFVAMTSGAAVVIAQIFGAGRREDVQKASGNALTVCAFAGIVIGAAGFLLCPQMLEALHTPAETMAGSVLYLRICFAAVPVVLLLNMESNMMRAVGNSVDPFVYMLVACVTNIVLDFVFVVFLHWGIAGVAAATVASQTLNLALLTVKLQKPDSPYRISRSQLQPNGRYLSNMVRLGVPAGCQAAMYSVSNMIIQIGVNTMGTVVVASWAMTSKVDGIYWAVSNALGIAITSFIAQNFGAGKTDRVKACVRQGLILAMAVSVFLALVIMLLAKPFLGVMTKDPDVVRTTFEMMCYFVPFYFTWSLIEVFSAVLRGSGDATVPVVIIGLGICLFRVIWMAAVFVRFSTVFVLCLSYPVSWVITGTALLIYYKRGRWMDRAQRALLEK